MSRKTWYSVALLLPLIFPLLLFALDYLSGNKNEGIGIFTGLFGVAFILSAPQYIVFTIWVYYSWRRKTADEIKLLSWRLPFIFAPICATTLLIWSSLLSRVADRVNDMVITFLVIMLMAIIYGMIYAAMAHMLTFLLQKMNLIKN